MSREADVSFTRQGAFIAVYRLLFTSLDFITPALLGILTTASSLEVAELTTGATGSGFM